MSVPKPQSISSELMNKRFNYDPETGVLTYSGFERSHLSPSMRCKKIDRIAGWKDTSGHLNIKVDNKDYLAHRLIWLRQTGSWPNGIIDHINGDKTDNRWANLRLTTQSVNCQNLMVGYPGSASGVLGVSPGATPNTWLSKIRVNKVLIYLGSFSSQDLAYEAYLNAKALVHPESTLVKGVEADLSKFSAIAIKNLKKSGHWPI